LCTGMMTSTSIVSFEALSTMDANARITHTTRSRALE
jgi:hypothetical protein